MSEEVLYQARRFWNAITQVSHKAGGPEYEEDEGLNLPSISGNTITGVDIVISPKVSAQPSGNSFMVDQFPTIVESYSLQQKNK